MSQRIKSFVFFLPDELVDGEKNDYCNDVYDIVYDCIDEEAVLGVHVGNVSTLDAF